MSDFNVAYKITSRHEGGWVHDPADKGGETYAGISRVYHPNWSGWSFLDTIPFKRTGTKFAVLNSRVSVFYKALYWQKNRLGDVSDQDVANVIFDWAVNSGGAIKKIQSLLQVVPDGIVGSLTIAAINRRDPAELFNAINSARGDYYRKLVDEGRVDSKFLKGLLARVEAFGVKKSLPPV